MRTSNRSGLSVLLLALMACGGGVGTVGGRDAGQGGAPPGEDGGIGGSPDCPPSSGINDGFACNINGLTCSGGQPVTDCQGRPLATPQCVCDGLAWTCEHLVATGDCSSPPPTSCPDPSMLVPGAPCDPGTMQQCVSVLVTVPGCDGGESPYKAVCSCQGSWVCPVPRTSPCSSPPPPQTCPDPVKVFTGESCVGLQKLVCAGNPQYCDGQTFYDALECRDTWVPIATTACSGDAGPGIDAGAPTFWDGSSLVDAADN